MAPEIKNGRKYTEKVDIYSLGIIIQDMFVIVKHNHIHEKLICLVKEMIDENPSQRPTSELALNRLNKILEKVNHDFNAEEILRIEQILKEDEFEFFNIFLDNMIYKFQ